MPDRLADLTATLTTWSPADPAQSALRAEYLAFLATNGPSALQRDGGPEHVTASCFVLTPDLSHVLLSLHRKGGFWVQLGGHLESDDASVHDAARREAAEEGGIDTLDVPWRTPVDLDRHALSDRFGRCRVHWDVGYVAFAAPGAQPTTSDESDDVAWFRVDGLPPVVPPGFATRLGTVLDVVRTRRQ
ncbi:NUDIX domain-containing protein [Actinotalea sp. AC32]|nr:NUDIX domain-containing protein [Actinotalea sp. AC32]